MKTVIVIACIAIGGVLWNSGNICSAQTPPTNVAQTSPTNLPAEVVDIVKLTQAKMGEAVILTKIKNNGASYNLTTDQIIYLSNQGLSQNVISALLQNKPADIAPVPAINAAGTNLNFQPSTAVVEPPPLDANDQTSVSDDPIIAKGKGFEIKRSQLDKVITALQSAAAAHGQTISPEQLSETEKQTLDRLILTQLLLQKASDDDKATGNKNAEAQINSLLDRAGSREALDQQLKDVGMTADELRPKVIQEATAIAVLQRELGAGTSTTGNEAEKYCNGLEKEAAVDILDLNLKQTPFEKLTASVPNARLFADHTRIYSFNYDKVWDAASAVLVEQHDKIIRSDKDSGGMITDQTRHGIIGFPSYYKYCLLIEKESDTSTKTTLKLLLYYMDFDGAKGPPNTLEPQNSEFTNKKAEDFLDKVEKRLEKGAIQAPATGVISDPVVEKLCESLEQDNPGKVIAALKTLRNMKATEATPKILHCLTDSNPDVVRETCRTLAVIGNQDAIPAIEPLLKNSRSNIREEAYKAITKLQAGH